MSASATCEPSRDILTDVLSARVPPGFSAQVRAAARARGERPGEFIRRALRDRIGGEGTDMTRETFYAAVGALAEGGDVHPDLKAALEEFADEKLPRFKDEFYRALTVAHAQLGKCLALASDFGGTEAGENREAIKAAGGQALVAAFSAMDEAQEIQTDLAHLAIFGTDA